jgi:drug/metabolite transporter (DMT)-like permease
MAAVGAVAFSGKAVIVKLGYRHGVDAVTLLMYRMLFALPLFLAVSAWASRGRPPLETRDRWAVLGLGFAGYYLASFLDFAGLAYVSASLERLILYLNPTLVMALAWVFFGRRIRRAQALALGVSYAGVVLVFAHELSLAGPHVLWGAGLVFGSALSYAAYLLFSGEVVHRVGALRLTGLATSWACLLCIAQFLWLRPLEAALVPGPVLWLSLLNATACTLCPVLLVMLAVERLGAGLAAQAGMIGPISTIVLGAWLLDESLTPAVMAGTALVLAGILLLARQGKP